MKIINCLLFLLFFYYVNGQDKSVDSSFAFKIIKANEKEFKLQKYKIFKPVKMNIDSTETYSADIENKFLALITLNQTSYGNLIKIHFYFLQEKLFKVSISYEILAYNHIKGNGLYYFLNDKLLYKEEKNIAFDISELLVQAKLYLDKGKSLSGDLNRNP